MIAFNSPRGDKYVTYKRYGWSMTRESKEPLWQRETLGEERQDTPDPLSAWPPIDDAHDDDADWEGE